jgi:hypothetical protein
MIDTRQVQGLCRRRFNNFDELLAEVRKLAEMPTEQLGNWSLGQICQHLGIAMRESTRAEQLFPAPLWLRLLGPWLRKRVLAHGMPRGFQLPPEGARLIPPPVSVEEGLATLEAGIAALAATNRRVRHPVFGAMSPSEWNQFHLRHAEMHLSFLVPRDQAGRSPSELSQSGGNESSRAE